MKSILAETYGGPEVLELAEVDVPKIGPNGVLVKIHASSVNPIDWKRCQGLLSPIEKMRFPVIWGCDCSGVVSEVGSAVTLFKPGDEVYGFKNRPVAQTYRGTYCEYAVLPENTLARKPANLSHEQAASIPLAAVTAWQALSNHGKIKPTSRVLIHAGAGGVGHFAIQIAKAFGASVAATASTRNLDFLRELGADLAIDHTRERVEDKISGYDIVLDGVGKPVWAGSFRAMRFGGRMITMTVPVPKHPSGRLKFFTTALLGLGAGMTRGLLTGKRLLVMFVQPRGGDLEKVSALVEAGKIRPTVERVFPLEQVAEAHRLSETGHTRGKIVIKVAN